MASSNNSELTEQQIQLLELKRNILAREIKLADLALTEFEAEKSQNFEYWPSLQRAKANKFLDPSKIKPWKTTKKYPVTDDQHQLLTALYNHIKAGTGDPAVPVRKVEKEFSRLNKQIQSAARLNKLIQSAVITIRKQQQVYYCYANHRILKMNTDGSVTKSQAGLGGRAGFGGVIRDAESGSWILGFYGKLNNCSSVEAELWGIWYGLQIIQDRDFGEVEIESDCEPAVHLINNETNTMKSINEIVEECKKMLKSTGCTLIHIGNETNNVAHEMAQLGREQDNAFVTFSSPPDEKIERLLVADAASAKSI